HLAGIGKGSLMRLSPQGKGRQQQSGCEQQSNPTIRHMDPPSIKFVCDCKNGHHTLYQFCPPCDRRQAVKRCEPPNGLWLPARTSRFTSGHLESSSLQPGAILTLLLKPARELGFMRRTVMVACLWLFPCAVFAQQEYVPRYDAFAGFAYLNSPKLNL